jgi:two-component system sensor histidine kinase CpxA
MGRLEAHLRSLFGLRTLYGRMPLYARIVLFFLLNLVIIGGVVFGTLKLRLGLGEDSPVRTRRGDPMVSLAEVIALELDRQPLSRWSSLLAARARSWPEVTLYLYAQNGAQIAGPDLRLPPTVIQRIVEDLPPPPGGPPHPPGQHPPGKHPPGKHPPGKHPPAKHPPGQHPPGKHPPGKHPPGRHPGKQGPPMLVTADGYRLPPPVIGRFAAESDQPKRYWVGIRVPVRASKLGDIAKGWPEPPPSVPTWAREFRLVVLLAASESMTGGGLFVDPWPWVWVAVAIVALSTLLWLPLVGGVTRPLRRMTAVTKQIARGEFDERLAVRRQDEIGQLSEAINQMSARLSALVGGQKRFLGDIAHELGSPIARIQMGLAVMQQRITNADGEQTRRLGEVVDDVEHMSQLVAELLSFSRAELNPERIQLEQVALEDVVARVVDRERLPGVDIAVDLQPGLFVIADSQLLARALANLLRNAIRYAADGGAIEIASCREDDQITVSVADHGPGVPKEQLSRLFEPFYRLDEARNASTGGVGLGLAIVRRCVEACQGEVHAENRAPSGLRVTITLEGI